MAWSVARENLSFYFSLFSPVPALASPRQGEPDLSPNSLFLFLSIFLTIQSVPSLTHRFCITKGNCPITGYYVVISIFVIVAPVTFSATENARSCPLLLFIWKFLFPLIFSCVRSPGAPLIARAESFETFVGSFRCIIGPTVGAEKVGGGNDISRREKNSCLSCKP